jgi:preprotein translocase subunit SecA
MSEIALEDTIVAATDLELPRAAPRPRRREHPDVDSPVTWLTSRLSVAASSWRSRQAKHQGRLAWARCQALAQLSGAALTQRCGEARAGLRARGLAHGPAVEALAIAGEYARRTLGLSPYAEQLACASALIKGAVTEMETGEGKTLAAFLAAATFGLAGRLVHVVAPNDYLAARDEKDLRPAYAALGLTTGLVIGGDSVQSRRKAYGADVVYVSSKEVVFDYLRDGLARSNNSHNSTLMAKLARTFGHVDGGNAAQPLQRALDVAIIDEIDSVLVDEAGTPLLISTNRAGDIGEDVARQALAIAADFKPGMDFAIDPMDVMPVLTFRGTQRMESATADLPGPWRVGLIREELIRAAIASHHILKRDHHYLVRDGKIVLIDQQSGRVTPDRHWSHGLSLMVEVREGCLSTGEKKSLASISFQRFFRGYASICGMSGTVHEVAAELHSVYGLKAASVKRRLPLRRKHAARRIFVDRDNLWAEAAQAAADLHRRGLPALVAVRSVGEADRASRALTALDVPHSVLSAAQDAAEAEIVANAGQRGVITVVTNMAGRGTDIRLGEGVAGLGGLVVMLCERHDSRRVDRQLIGRCARQGDPGQVMEFVSREDSALRFLGPVWRSVLARLPKLTALAVAWSQRLSEQRSRNARLQLLRRDEQLAKLMAFAGGLD